MSGYTQIESDVPQTPIGNLHASQDTSANVASGSISQPQTERTLIQRLKESSHPSALLFYIFFRITPIFMYLFGNLFLALFTKESRFILHFIILILLISADFWNLKNISGRLLVGLRWWNETNVKEGSSEFENVWVFETADPERYINPVDSKVFWVLLYVQPLAWAVLGIMAVLKFEFLYLILIVISISLSLTNAIAFTKCDKFGKANLMANNIFSRATTGFLSRINPFA